MSGNRLRTPKHFGLSEIIMATYLLVKEYSAITILIFEERLLGSGISCNSRFFKNTLQNSNRTMTNVGVNLGVVVKHISAYYNIQNVQRVRAWHKYLFAGVIAGNTTYGITRRRK